MLNSYAEGKVSRVQEWPYRISIFNTQELGSFHLQYLLIIMLNVYDKKKMEERKEAQKSKKESWSGGQFKEMR